AAADEVVAAAEAALGPGRVRGPLVEALVAPGVELLVAVRREPGLGPVVTVGAGGELVEVLRDTASRLAPVGEAEAEAMSGVPRGGERPRAGEPAPRRAGRARRRSGHGGRGPAPAGGPPAAPRVAARPRRGRPAGGDRPRLRGAPAAGRDAAEPDRARRPAP